VLFVCSACTNKTINNQKTEVSNFTEIQETQQINAPAISPSVTEETQPTSFNDNSITKVEVCAFFNDYNEFAIKMLINPAADMTNLEDIMWMILYPLGASSHKQISFSEFNSYTMKYLNKSFSDSDYKKYATDENVPGINVVMSKKVLYLSGVGDEVLAIENIELIGNDTVLLTCARGLNWYELDTIDEVIFTVKFGRANSQLYIISILKQ
jgi:hypothetical protein